MLWYRSQTLSYHVIGQCSYADSLRLLESFSIGVPAVYGEMVRCQSNNKIEQATHGMEHLTPRAWNWRQSDGAAFGLRAVHLFC